jgi:hypothetical protein
MGISTSDVAWYAAIVATLSLAFTVFKWSLERARLQVRIVPNTWYPDGGFKKEEQTPQGTIRTGQMYFHIEVANVGERPTTIMGVSATTQPLGLLEKFHQWRKPRGISGFVASVFTPHYEKNPPHVIGPGEVWSCRVPDDRVYNLCQMGIPKLELTAACRVRPFLYRFPIDQTKRSSMIEGEITASS